ncbi:MAG: hypothetical protein AAF193_03470, partial [Bacteroidota bacterium]
MIIWKIIFLDYSYENILPKTVHELNITMSMEGFGDDVSINTYLPLSSNRQSIYDESQESVDFGYSASSDANGKLVTWESDQLNGQHNIRYSFRVISEAVVYDIPADLPRQAEYHPSITSYLDPTSTIQSNHPRIIERCANILAEEELPLKETIQLLFNDVKSLPSRPFKGLTDALTTLKLGEASCNGKSRLLIAMASGSVTDSSFSQSLKEWASMRSTPGGSVTDRTQR